MPESWFGVCAEDTFLEHTETMMPRVMAREAILCIGSVHLLNGLSTFDLDNYVFLIFLDDILLKNEVNLNTILLSFKSDKEYSYFLVDFQGRQVRCGTVAGNRLFNGMYLGDQLIDVIRRNCATDTVKASGTFAPLFVTRYKVTKCDELSIYRDWYSFGQVRFRGTDALFIRLHQEAYTWVKSEDPKKMPMLGTGNIAPMGWLEESIRLHRDNFLFLNNHQCYYKKCFKDNELEYKYNLEGEVDIWSLTRGCYERIKDDQLPGYILEYGDEFQQWDYMNYLYEIPSPESEQGYISFIPTTDGLHTIKRKWFIKDQFSRRESLYHRVDVKGSFDRHIEQEFGLTYRRLPPFRRIRYDVNLESVKTGHVYGIFFDHCLVAGAPINFLVQCEIEYLRSRVCFDPDEDSIMGELAEVSDWTEAYMNEHDVNFSKGVYSKLSFLKDYVGSITTV